jgi:hypothetical protein
MRIDAAGVWFMVCFPFGCAPGTRDTKKPPFHQERRLFAEPWRFLFGSFDPHIAWFSKQATVGFLRSPDWHPAVFRPQEFLMLVREYHAIRGMQQPRAS